MPTESRYILLGNEKASVLILCCIVVTTCLFQYAIGDVMQLYIDVNCQPMRGLEGQSDQGGNFPLPSSVVVESRQLETRSGIKNSKSYKPQCSRVVCYYTKWSQYSQGPGKLVPEDIEPNLCTHVIYAFAKLEGNRLVSGEWNDDSTNNISGMYERVTNLKKKNPFLKVLLAVGGGLAGSRPLTQVLRSPTNRREFVTNTIQYLLSRHFDGLDLHWENSADSGNPAEDKHRFVLLVKGLSLGFHNESHVSGRPRLLLTAAVPAEKDKIDSSYAVPHLARYLDFASLMAFDYRRTTGHNNHLSKGSSIKGKSNMVWSAIYWVSQGIPKNKLVIGLPFYGRSFILGGPSSKLGSSNSSSRTSRPVLGDPGVMAYYEVCKLVQMDNSSVTRVSKMGVPFVVNGNQWVRYDDQKSLGKKVNFVLKNQFGGVMVWSLVHDDTTGTECNEGPRPLLTAVNKRCNR